MSDSVDSSPSAAPQPVFRVRGLTKIYGTGAAEVRALAGVDLDLYASELVVLLGPSGSGKTTLLNNLGGLDVPTAGELQYRGQDLTDFDEAELTRYRRDTRRLRLSVLQPHPQPDGARERRPHHRDCPRPDAGRGGARDGQSGRAARPFPRPALRRRAAARGHCAGHRQAPRSPPVRRAHRRAGRETGIVVLEAIQRANRELGTLTVIITHNAIMADMADRVIHLSDGHVHHLRVNEHRVPASSLNW